MSVIAMEHGFRPWCRSLTRVVQIPPGLKDDRGCQKMRVLYVVLPAQLSGGRRGKTPCNPNTRGPIAARGRTAHQWLGPWGFEKTPFHLKSEVRESAECDGSSGTPSSTQNRALNEKRSTTEAPAEGTPGSPNRAAIGRPSYVGEPRARQRRGVESAIPEQGSRATAAWREHCLTMRDRMHRFERRPEYHTRSATRQSWGGSRRRTYMFRCNPFWSMTCGEARGCSTTRFRKRFTRCLQLADPRVPPLGHEYEEARVGEMRPKCTCEAVQKRYDGDGGTQVNALMMMMGTGGSKGRTRDSELYA
ncbi:hypothetical protein BJV78DRAFT_1154774 [Lactifluus subvellereus]|nr:hypothetical protein BJV78DRAFT_1154774 [Lactifluus subvellereus]